MEKDLGQISLIKCLTREIRFLFLMGYYNT